MTVPRNSRDPITIGRPLDNMRLYILDRYMEPAPVAVPGQLFIAGDQLAMGYTNRPSLTAERFIPNPFGKAGSRLYQSGDFTRFRADGQVAYIGRADHQVKLLGNRIELGEIENLLNAITGIEKSAVIVHRNSSGRDRLVAYAQLSHTTPLKGKDDSREKPDHVVRRHLMMHLPAYMVPSRFVFLDELPLTHSGKINRKALYALKIEDTTARVGPRTPIERALAEIWRDILGVENVAADDNFFELGGDSILSIQVVSRARKLGISLDTRTIMESGDLAELAASIGQETPVPSEDAPVAGFLPLTPIQTLFFSQDFVAPHHYNQALLLRTRVSPEPLCHAITRLHEHHDMLRARFPISRQGYRQEIVPPGGEVSFETVDLSPLGQKARREAIETKANSCQASFNLNQATLFRAVYFRLDEEARLLLVAHHLIVDGVSWRILVEDLEVLCGAETGVKPTLAPKTTTYRDWAQALLENSRNPFNRPPYQRMCHKLTSSEPGPKLLSADRGLGTRGEMGLVHTNLDEDATRALLMEAGRPYGNRTDEILLTAIAHAIASWSGDQNLRFDVEGHGRETDSKVMDSSRTVGWFTTICPVILELPESGQPGPQLIATKEALRASLKDGPFFFAAIHLREERHWEPPPARILFNYLGRTDAGRGKDRLFQIADEPIGALVDPRNAVQYPLEINALVAGGRLNITWAYSEGALDGECASGLAQAAHARLETLINHCLHEKVGALTPSDFPLVDLSLKELAHINANQAQVEDILPLTALQQVMLLHNLTDEERYFEQLSFTLHDLAFPKALQRAWQVVVDRHASLRCEMHWEGLRNPVQVIRREVVIPWREENWKTLSPQARASLLESLYEEDRRTPIAPDKAPLMKLTLIDMGGNSYRIIWCYHHLLFDGWSLPILFGEILEGYRAIVANEPLVLPKPYAYGAYLTWLQGRNLEEAQSYWRKQLAGMEAPTYISTIGDPTASPLKGNPKQAVRITTQLTEQLSQDLDHLVRTKKLTLHTVLLAAYGLWLAARCGSEDICFGTTVSGRSSPELPGLEQAVGLFINTLPVRLRIDRSTRVIDWLRTIHVQETEAMSYEYCPLNKIAECSPLPPDLDLFDTLMVLENYPIPEDLENAGQGLYINDLISFEKTNFPLIIVVAPGLPIDLRLDYFPTSIPTALIEQLIEDLPRILTDLAAQPSQPVGALLKLPEEEQRRLLALGSGPVRGPSPHLGSWLEDSLARNKANPALVMEGNSITYAQLAERSAQLATLLAARGTRPGSWVGILLERSPELVIAIAAIIRLGAAYVPMDLSYPPSRLGFLVEDARMENLVTDSNSRSRLPKTCPARLILIDEMYDLKVKSDFHPRPHEGGTLAYMIYTSGSTGKPKGVVVPGNNLTNYSRWHIEQYRITPKDRVSLTAGVAFDASCLDIWPSLLAGAALYPLATPIAVDPRRLYEAIAEHGITIAFASTPIAEALIQLPPPPGLALRMLQTGGDKLNLAPANLPFRLVNVYGPTENTIITTTSAVTPEQIPPTIGFTIDNLWTCIVDGALEMVAQGSSGELVSGGAGVTMGYHNRPALTATSFVPNPFTREPGGRLYRTGDRACMRPNGEFVFLGRLDHQVKIRGLRIELGEIESVLRTHEMVEEAVVLIFSDMGIDKYLAAYVTLSGETECESTLVAELKHHITKSLPPHMVPPIFTVLDQFPLNINSKLDRQALPKPERNSERDEYKPPADEQEAHIARILAEMLGLKRVGRDDNFFELGGHSLLVLKTVARLQTELNTKLTVTELFHNPSVAQLSGHINRRTELLDDISASEEQLGEDEEEFEL